MTDQLDRIESKIDEFINQNKTLIELITNGYKPIPDVPAQPNLPYVTVREKTPLMEVSNYDENNKIVLRLHKYGILKRGRIRAKARKELYYLKKVDTAQGVAFRLSPDQDVDGKSLTIGARTPPQQIPGTRNPREYDRHFYILKTKVRV